MKKIFFVLLIVCSVCIFTYMFEQKEDDVLGQNRDGTLGQNGGDMFEQKEDGALRQNRDYAFGQNVDDTLEQNLDDTLEQNERDAFIKKVISNFGTNGFWVSINVESPEYNGKAVIENVNLYMYFKKFKSIDRRKYEDTIVQMLKKGKREYNEIWDQILAEDREEYKKVIYQVLRKKTTIKIKKKGDFDKYMFKVVFNDSAIIEDAKKGIDHFIETYFRCLINSKGEIKGYVLNNRYIRNAVISQLYDLNIASRINDETGDLMAGYKKKND